MFSSQAGANHRILHVDCLITFSQNLQLKSDNPGDVALRNRQNKLLIPAKYIVNSCHDYQSNNLHNRILL